MLWGMCFFSGIVALPSSLPGLIRCPFFMLHCLADLGKLFSCCLSSSPRPLSEKFLFFPSLSDLFSPPLPPHTLSWMATFRVQAWDYVHKANDKGRCESEHVAARGYSMNANIFELNIRAP